MSIQMKLKKQADTEKESKRSQLSHKLWRSSRKESRNASTKIIKSICSKNISMEKHLNMLLRTFPQRHSCSSRTKRNSARDQFQKYHGILKVKGDFWANNFKLMILRNEPKIKQLIIFYEWKFNFFFFVLKRSKQGCSFICYHAIPADAW